MKKSLRYTALCAGKLLEWFSPGWAISLHVVPPTPDMAHSPLQPLLVVVQRAHVDRGPGCAPVRLCFMPPFTGPNAEQLTDVWKVPFSKALWGCLSKDLWDCRCMTTS